MNLFYNNKHLIIRVLLSLLFLVISFYFINAGLEVLRPNSLLVCYDSEDSDYKVEVDLDTGDGFGRNIIGAGEVSDHYLGKVESLRIYFKASGMDLKPIGIRSIAMLRYAGIFDAYLPVSIKTWEGEDILKDFEIKGDHESSWVEDDIIYISSDIQLEYRGDFGRAYMEMNKTIAEYSYWLKILAVFGAILVFFISGIYFANLPRIKSYLDSIGYSFSLKSKLLCIMLFCMIFSVLVPLYMLKLPFIVAAIISGSTIIFINRNGVKEETTSFDDSKPHLIILLVIIAMVLGAFTFSYKLGEHDLREDEFQVVDAAAGYYYEGDFYRWDWIENEFDELYYDRAYPHTFLIAQSYELFGISEWSSRIVSVVLGILFLPALFLMVRYFTENKYLALLVVYLAVFYDSYIYIFRYARMYALLIPIFTLLVYIVYKGLTEKTLKDSSSNNFYRFLYENFNFNYYYLILALAVFYLSYLIHLNALIIMPSTLIFIILLLYKTREKRYLNMIYISLAGLIVVGSAYYLGKITPFDHFISLFRRRNFEYIEYLSEYPFPWEAGIVFIALGLVAALLLNGSLKTKLLYLYTIIGFALLFFIFIADRYNSFFYISHLTPISLALLIFGGFQFLRVMNSRIVNFVLAGALLICVGINYYQNYDRLYTDAHRFGSFSYAYNTIVMNYEPEKEVIFGQFLRDYYLQDLQGKKVVTIDMLRDQDYSYETFINDLKKYEAGWVTWETRKERHLETDILNLVEDKFEKIHGQGIDNSRVEVYYFKKSDLY